MKKLLVLSSIAAACLLLNGCATKSDSQPAVMAPQPQVVAAAAVAATVTNTAATTATASATQPPQTMGS